MLLATMNTCGVDGGGYTLTIYPGTAKVWGTMSMLGIGGCFLAKWIKNRQPCRKENLERTNPEGRNLDEFLGKDVDDLVDTIVPHLLVHQRLYRSHRKRYGPEFEYHCTYVDVVIGKLSAALGPTCEEIRSADEDSEPMSMEEIGDLVARSYLETSEENIVDEWYRTGRHRTNRHRASERNIGESDDNDEESEAEIESMNLPRNNTDGHSSSSFSESNLTPLSEGSNATVYRPMPTTD